MSLSRGWGDDLEQQMAGGDPEYRRRLARTIIALLVVIAVGGSAWLGWATWMGHCEPLLVESRRLLQESLHDPPQSIQNLQTAETWLREYLDRGGAEEDSARLLLCAALTLRGVYDPDRRISQAHDIEELLNSIRPAGCALTDLLIAIEIFIHSGRLAQADWLMGGAVQVSEGTPDHRRVLRKAIPLRYDLGREKEVLEHCAVLAEMDPSDPEPWRQMAMVYEDGGYEERLIETLQRIVQLDEHGAAEDRLKLIDALISVGQRSQARAEYDILAERSPELTERHPLTLAKLLMLESDTAAATAKVAKILDEDPQATDALLFRGQLLLSQNRLPEAMETIERLLELDPMNFQAHYVLGQITARLGQRERAQQHLALHRKILDARVEIHTLERRAGRNPNDTEAQTQLIHLYDSLGMTQHAEFWRRASRISGHATNP